ncbi:MAG: hypothetical protein HY859_09550 [Caulobacterales bacterium]|nr:hypothetical protein [Caulobacterales bacterium]
MANEQGLLKQTVFAKQSGLAVPATTGGKVKRRTNSVFTKAVATWQSNEIVAHQQSTGDNAGPQTTSGKLDAIISPSTFSEMFASLLRKDFAATAAITAASFTIAVSGAYWTITRAAGSWLTDGVKAGDVGRITAGTFNAANLNKNLLVLAVNSATVLLVVPVNKVALVAEGPITGATWTTPGKKAWVPTTGHTNDYWTVEELYTGLTLAEQFNDVKIGKADITAPPVGPATVSFDCPGLYRTRNAQTIAAPAAETTTNPVKLVSGMVVVNGVPIPITSFTTSITGNIKPGEAEAGEGGAINQIKDHIRGEVAATLQIMAKFSANTIQTLFDNETVFKVFLVLADSQLAAADFVTLVYSACKCFGDAPNDGEAVEIVRTYPITPQINGSGGAALADLQTIVSMQDSQAV